MYACLSVNLNIAPEKFAALKDRQVLVNVTGIAIEAVFPCNEFIIVFYSIRSFVVK